MSTKQSNKNTVNYTIVKDLIESIKRIQYGSICIKVHDSKIVQVEVTERSRFDDWFVDKGGGI